jgi:dTDP-4-amino-4,6-dideoxygalactose transaminase
MSKRQAGNGSDTAPSWPVYGADERDAVSKVLESGKVNYWTGVEGREFEREYARYLNTAHAIAVGNGTVGLELALRAWNIGPGDEVIVTPRSFVASASCVSLLGARPVFADIDRDSGNLSAHTIDASLTPKTRAVIAVHLGGWPCDMQPILQLADERGLKVLEDCAQAHGATCDGKAVGSLGHASAFSFCQDKIVTTGGEGGLVATDDAEFWNYAWSFKDHGKSWEAVYQREHAPGYRWLHESFGTNWRLTEIQSAIGRVQLRKLDRWVEKRRENAGVFEQRLSNLRALRLPLVPQHLRHAYYRYYAYVRDDGLRTNWSRDRMMQEISAQGVPCSVGSCPEIYRERAFASAGYGVSERAPTAAELGETSLAFLVHPTLDTECIHRWCDSVTEVVRKATR